MPRNRGQRSCSPRHLASDSEGNGGGLSGRLSQKPYCNPTQIFHSCRCLSPCSLSSFAATDFPPLCTDVHVYVAVSQLDSVCMAEAGRSSRKSVGLKHIPLHSFEFCKLGLVARGKIKKAAISERLRLLTCPPHQRKLGCCSLLFPKCLHLNENLDSGMRGKENFIYVHLYIIKPSELSKAQGKGKSTSLDKDSHNHSFIK